MILGCDAAVDELRKNFPGADEALERCSSLLELQQASLMSEPPLKTLPDAIRIAASVRLRDGALVIPRERMPVDARRAAGLLRALARTILDEPVLIEARADELLAAALPPALADDGRGVAATVTRLELPEAAAGALLREALKPEMLRTSEPLRILVEEAGPRAARCPVCGGLPAAGTESKLDLCCCWCGTVWRWDGKACGGCGSADLHEQELSVVVRRARFLQCRACGEVIKLFPTVPDALVLSLHAVLTAPFDLAARVHGHASPTGGFPVF